MDRDRKQRENSEKRKKDGLFDKVLRNAINEEMAPTMVNTVVYGRDARVSALHYKTREYHY